MIKLLKCVTRLIVRLTVRSIVRSTVRPTVRSRMRLTWNMKSFLLSFVLLVFVMLANTYAQDRVDVISPFLQLSPESKVQFGVIGFNPEHDLEPVLVFNLASQGLNSQFGKSKDGLLFDFGYTKALADTVNFSFNTRNHAWGNKFSDTNFTIRGKHQLLATESSTFTIRPEVVFGYANQIFPNAIANDARLGLVVSEDWQQDLQGFGQFKLTNTNRVTYYPATSQSLDALQWQYAVRFQPTWSFSVNDHRFVTRYDFQTTNGASPFDGNIDRQGKINKIDFAWTFNPSVQKTQLLVDNLTSNMGFSYDFLKDSTKNQSPLRSVYWNLDLEERINEVLWRGRLELQTAAFISPIDDPSVRASITFNNDFYHHDWRYHLKGQYKFVHPDNENNIDILEFGLGPVIEFESKRYRPYLAIDVADPLFNDGALTDIAISGIGFEVLK